MRNSGRTILPALTTTPSETGAAGGRILVVALSLLLSLALSSCGYHLSGTGSLLPPGTRTIAVGYALARS